MHWRWIFFLLLLLNGFLLFQLFISPDGLFRYLELNSRAKELRERVQRVNEENLRLSREIRKLKSENVYLQKVIRTKMHFVQENEVLYLKEGEQLSK